MAGASYRDEAAILDGQLLTARSSDERPEFNRRMMAMVRSLAALQRR